MKNEKPIWADRQLTSAEAIAIFKSEIWATWTDEQIFRVQAWQQHCCVPFHRFRQAVQRMFTRQVHLHELVSLVDIQREYLKNKSPPTFEEILWLLPIDIYKYKANA